VDRTARADYVGRQYTALLAGGYRYYRWCAIFTPLASLQYSYLSVNKYHEHGAQDLNLHVEGQHYDFLESGLGLKIARPIQTTCGAFIPEVHALWLYNFHRNAMHLKTTLSGVAAQSGTFETDGPDLDVSSGDVGAGITFISCTNLTIAAFYNYEFSKSWDAHKARVRISYQF
jgi:outer membrane autotransporter protein